MTDFTQDFRHQQRWNDYYKAVEGRPPRETLLAALAQFEAEPVPEKLRLAVDLGCGDGRDTVALLQRGWRVLAIDGNEEAIARLTNRSGIDSTHLETRVQRFEDLELPDDVDLINASFCLPFCPPARFPAMWETLVASLKTGGRFCGQLFGDRDSWAANPTMTHQTRQQVEALLQPFVVEQLQEEDHPGKTALGEDKHWHIWHLVIRKAR